MDSVLVSNQTKIAESTIMSLYHEVLTDLIKTIKRLQTPHAIIIDT